MRSTAVVGLGAMGMPIAHRLLDAGVPLTVHDSRAEPMEVMSAAGATTATRLSDCRAVDVALIVVANADQVREVLLGEHGLASADISAGDSAPRIVVVMSTIGRQAILDVQRQVEARGIKVVDAPISGGASHANRGSLSILAAGDYTAMESVRPQLELLGHVFSCGPVGNAQLIKVANNVIGNLSTLAVAEVGRLLRGYGIDMAVANQVFEASSGRNWLSSDPAMAQEQYARLSVTRGVFDATTAIVRKDAQLALDIATESGGDYPLIEALVTLTRAVGDETYQNWSAAGVASLQL
ncbi:MAG: NAD(P)-dependent oxidoreductase [Rhodococcus sp. (in: high G+C Gram-positive bacteria)]|nr:MAG: NAD(P)-dependent oxidoreductase [Rhodococcus sp. (in: high G+C Gram-positive bacteria)]